MMKDDCRQPAPPGQRSVRQD